MALGSSIYKANINLANLDSNIYEDISLTIALHPSETQERMMIRLIAFLFSFEEHLEFSDGLNNPDLPDIWKKNLMGDIDHWIDIGQPDEKRIKKASGKSNKVSIFTYDTFKNETWFKKISSKVKSNKKIKIFNLATLGDLKLDSITQRTMSLNCVIEDQNMFLSDDEHRVHISIQDQIL